MPLLTTLLTGATLAYKGGKALGLFGKAKMPPGYRKSPAELASEKLLKKRAEMGLSPAERFQALNVGSAATSAYTEAAKRRLEGRAQFQGVSSLVAGEGAKQIEAGGVKAVSDISTKISLESEAVKRGAEGELLRVGQRTSDLEYRDAMARYGVSEQNRQTRSGAFESLISSLPAFASQLQSAKDQREFLGIFEGGVENIQKHSHNKLLNTLFPRKDFMYWGPDLI